MPFCDIIILYSTNKTPNCAFFLLSLVPIVIRMFYCAKTPPVIPVVLWPCPIWSIIVTYFYETSPSCGITIWLYYPNTLFLLQLCPTVLSYCHNLPSICWGMQSEGNVSSYFIVSNVFQCYLIITAHSYPYRDWLFQLNVLSPDWHICYCPNKIPICIITSYFCVTKVPNSDNTVL